MKVYESIVVGGGIIGATTAAMISGLGIEVALLESATCAARGGSAYSGGIVRLYDADPAMMSLALHAQHIRHTHRVGRVFDMAIRRTGVLYRAHASDEDSIRRALHNAGHDGCGARFLSSRRLGDLTGFVQPCPDKIDLYEPEGGHSDVRFATHSMAHLVRDQGLVIEHAPVVRLGHTENGLAEVHLASGAVLRARCVFVAVGPWARRLIGWLPVEARTVPLGLLEMPQAPHLPVIDMTVGSYAVPFGPTVLGVGCGLRHAADWPDDLPAPDQRHVANSLEQLAALSGPDTTATALGVLNGIDSYTPDARPIIGFCAPDSPFYVATGMAGLGFKIAPAIADLAATEIQARLRDLASFPTALLNPFRMDRFQTGLAPAQTSKG